MKSIFFLLTLLFPIICTSQEESKVEEKKSKFSIGVNFSANSTFRLLKSPPEYNFSLNVRESESFSMGFNTGISTQYQISKRLEFSLGLQYSKYSYIEDFFLYDPNGYQLGTGSYEAQYQSIEAPLQIAYRFFDRKLFAYVFGGISTNFNLNIQIITQFKYFNQEPDKRVFEDYPLQGISPASSILGGIGIGYQLNNKFNLRIEPTYKRFVTFIFDTPIQQYNYSYGVQLGVNMKL